MLHWKKKVLKVISFWQSIKTSYWFQDQIKLSFENQNFHAEVFLNPKFITSIVSSIFQLLATIYVTTGAFVNGGVIGYSGPANPSFMAPGAQDLYGNDLSVTFQEVSWISKYFKEIKS